MTFLLQIIAQDHKKNHPERDSFLGTVEEILTMVIDGWAVDRFGDTLIIYRPTGLNGQGIEFHCFHGGNGSELAINVLEFFRLVKEDGFEWCQTPYSNEKIKQLFEANIEPENLITIVEADGRYLTTVRL